MFFCLKNCKQNSACFSAFCVQKFLTRRRKVSQSLRGVVSHRRHGKHRILLRRLPIFFQLTIQIFFHAEKINFHALVIKIPCLEKNTRVGNKITRVGNKIGRQSLSRPFYYLTTSNPRASTALMTASRLGVPVMIASPEARSMLTSVTPLTPRMARSALALQWLHDMPLI